MLKQEQQNSRFPKNRNLFKAGNVNLLKHNYKQRIVKKRITVIFLFYFFSVVTVFSMGKTITADVNGNLIDINRDGIFDSLNVVGLEINTMVSIKRRIVGILEFSLPANPERVEKVVLRLYLNGKYGCTAWPEKKGVFGPNCNLFGYDEPNADGKIMLSDDGCGEKIGRLLKAESFDVKKPVLIDVTDFYNRSVDAGKSRIGFRIEADEKDPGSEFAWRFRSLTFAAAFGQKYAPSLIITVVPRRSE